MLATYAFSVEHAKQLNDKNVLSLVGDTSFATRIPASFDTENIKELIENNINFELVVNDLFHEGTIEELTKYLILVNEIGVKKIRFADLAVIQIAKEENLNFEFTYDPEMLITSYGTFEFWKSKGVTTVGVAREMFGYEYSQMVSQKGDMKLSIQIHGHQFMMQSKRSLISNYKNHFEYDFDACKPIRIKEVDRKEDCIIYEDNKGTTNMFTGYDLCAAKHLKMLSKFDVLVINNLFHNIEWTNNVVDLYIKGFKGESVYDELAKLSHVTEGFFNTGVYVYERN